MGIGVRRAHSPCSTGTGAAVQVGIQIADSVAGMSYSFTVTSTNSGTVLSGSAV